MQTAEIVLGILLPMFGTTLGAATVFFLINGMNKNLEKLLLGFASGVMIAASVWSLLIPAIEMSEKQNQITWLPAVIGFLSGIFFLLLLDKLIPHLHANSQKPEGKKTSLGKNTMLMLAVTLHNIPEGMAVGVVFAGVLANNGTVSLASAFTLAIGIAIQNIPEGAIISMPLRSSGYTKFKSFNYGFLSGIAEPIGAVLTLILTSLVVPVLPYILSFAAGAMIYVVVEELIPQSQEGDDSDIGTIGVAFGFTLMMLLDVALG